jgi:two-component system, OmpR family, sensor kinase
VASLGSSIRSAARATFSAYRSLPIRWRLAGGSAALTFVILAAFAVLVGLLTTRQLRNQFNDQVGSAASQLRGELNLRFLPNGELTCNKTVSLSDYVSAQHAQIRIFDARTGDPDPLCTQDQVRIKGTKQPPPTPAFPVPSRGGTFQELGYRVVVPRHIETKPKGDVWLLYAVPLSDLDHTLNRVQFFLLLGVLGGTFLALLAGLTTAQRAIRPISQLTDAAREIERTRDPSRHIPLPKADDEVAELARTLEGMLQGLDEARGVTEASLARQREFVADASHELRTPLTSVLTSLELLSEELEGEQADTAEAALRSAHRMRRLVADLLLLARVDAKRVQPHQPTPLDEVLTEAAAEIGPVAEDHALEVDAEPAIVSGVRDDLHRLVLNLIENAVKHTPPGTHVRASTTTVNDDAMLVVEDDGPGIPEDLRPRIFDRFVRGAGDRSAGGRNRARGSGLGLSIVRAVAESHGGEVTLDLADGHGARFVVSLPSLAGPEPNGDHTSTTTGSTIGRRRSRS